uniref:carboxymuconolactone decarboxylase family protein n=1 Tax=Thermotoga maritima (strain ATCC 43589 / DSM 3109 / JCM 10099 / NBRC 100826 / MSB8) TaxID=243274 RepID=UPI0000378F25|nr:Chain A, carboxymuconolactone decarboxylase family protein [Thermotoga maritima MSB8]1VKE_B Chain B, carboxymuconolactone decarboxylase family protein [Thermotoga maritima MSB8]1VKE_C Chain C, carboxymuconolactone decarboxylase family protein [Thermotoga maritima MSB8]1VKE_D Chain D, carboxymuconolactone decarboxylase family protein [Thermotoga maritima MSB8]1VKE_E Chain E, carboxymuconolactone decarboxylase family protein [Thermotoga maritima MSB8]1VKE_F Chain F, carboxymuconolactone decar
MGSDKIHHHHHHMEYKKFVEARRELNEKVLSRGTLNTKRFFNLDSAVYRPGKLDVKTKELMGLVASTVLRCDDCIRYHLVRCVQEGASDEEIFEALDIALVVGGSIVIPHLRRAVGFLEELREMEKNGETISL